MHHHLGIDLGLQFYFVLNHKFINLNNIIVHY